MSFKNLPQACYQNRFFFRFHFSTFHQSRNESCRDDLLCIIELDQCSGEDDGDPRWSVDVVEAGDGE